MFYGALGGFLTQMLQQLIPNESVGDIGDTIEWFSFLIIILWPLLIPIFLGVYIGKIFFSKVK